MRTLTIGLLSVLGTVSAWAQGTYKEPDVQAVVNQYQKDREWIQALNWDNPGTPVKSLDCLDEDTLFRAAGLHQITPQGRKEIGKITGKLMREMGFDPKSVAEEVSNIQVVPLAGECVSGKVNGKIRLYGGYDGIRRQRVDMIMDGKSAGADMTSYTQHRTFTETDVADNKLTESSLSVMQMTVRQEQKFDDPGVQALSESNNKKLGLDKPMVTKSITYRRGKLTAVISETMEKKVSGGLFGVNVKEVPSMSVMVMAPVDDIHGKTTMYKDGHLLSESYTKNGKPHGPNTTYMENFAKKLGMPLSKMPGMENAKEAVIDGRDVIVQVICMQDGKQIKDLECPRD